MRMKGDTDLQTLEVEKTLPRKVVEGKRCNSRSFQSIESKQWGGSEENRKNRTVKTNAGIATQAKCVIPSVISRVVTHPHPIIAV